MRIKVSTLPFVICLIAMPVNWVIGFSGVPQLVWLPELLAIASFVGLAVLGKLRPSLPTGQLLLIVGITAQMMLHVAGGRGTGASAILSVAVAAVIFLAFLEQGTPDRVRQRLMKQIGIIYGTHVVFILLEVFLLTTGMSAVLVRASGGFYKTAGAEGTYGNLPQSLSLQSQAASQFSLFAALWFGMRYLARVPLGAKFRAPHLLIAVAGLAVFVNYPNTTMQIIGVLMLISVIYFSPFAPNALMRVLILVSVALALRTVYLEIEDKFGFAYTLMGGDAPWRMVVYQRAFSSPIEAFASLSFFNKLWGVGGEASLRALGITDADFAFAIVVLQVGLLTTIAALLGCLRPAWRLIRAAHGPLLRNPATFPWVWLGYTNALFVIGNVLSILHYSVALQGGGRTLFSFHIAATLYCWRRIKQLHADSAVPEPA